MKVFLNTTLVLILSISGVVQSDVYITPSGTVQVNENNSVTLTCRYTGSRSLQLFKWLEFDTTKGSITPTCQHFGPLNTTKYSYNCSNDGKQVSWTVKTVDRSSNGATWRCDVVYSSDGKTENGNTVTISVRVPIKNVTMVKPASGDTITILENTAQEFRCRTDGGLPVAEIIWYKVNGTSSISTVGTLITNSGSATITTSSSTLSDGLITRTSSLTYRPTSVDNGMRIYCSASNVDNQDRIFSRQPLLKVLYQATGPFIDGYTNGGTYQVTENTTGSLTCRTFGGNPLPTLSWSCYSGSTSNGTTGTTVVKTRTWSATRDTDRMCTCTSEQQSLTGTQTVSVQVEILYPPSTPVLKVNSISVGNTVKVILNNNLRIQCSSSGKPIPSYTWTLPNNSQQHKEWLEVNDVQKPDKGRYTCRVTNNPGTEQVTKSSSTTVEVLFGPTTPTIYYNSTSGSPISTNTHFNIVVGDTWPIVCQSEGQPAPSYTWTIDNKQYTGQTTTLPAVYRNMKTSIRCTADNVLEQTGSTETTPKSSFSSVTMSIMYPPTDLAISLKYGTGNDITVPESINVLEDAAFVLKCQGSSNPGPSYHWSVRGSQISSEISIPSGTISRNGSHVYMCEVTNQMTRSYGTPTSLQGRNTINVTVYPLYGPEITTLINRSAEEGESFSYRCPYTPGNPALTTVKWTRAKDSRTWNSELLDITTISKNDAMMYTCTVSNEMKPTNKDPVTDPKSGQFYLDVKYKATVTSFKVGQNSGSVTVDENMSPTLVCNVESNPVSNMTILFKNQTLTENANSLQLTHQISTVSCSNIGVYKCTGRNYLNAQTQSTKDIELFVKCSPQEYGETVATVYTALHNPSTLRLHLLAYPTIKSFTWTKLGTTDEILKNSTKVSMNISRVKVDGIYIDIFQLDLTLNNVSKSDLGTYKLFARNDQGTIERDFVLEPEDSPEQPTRLTHLEKYITTTKATIQWEPGFNGGPNQTFILLYKRMTDSEWNTIPVKESGESIMNYTLTGLQSDTKYEVKMYAQNRVGNSSTTSSIEIHTLAITENPTNIAPIIGGAVGGAAGLVVVIVIVVVFLRRYGPSKGKRGSDTELHRRSVSEDSDNDVMTENPSYVSSGAVAGFASGGASGGDNTYSQVQKKPKITVPAGNADVYAVVKKPNKKETKNKQKAKSSANDNQAGDVYENVQPKNGIQSSDNTYGNVGAQASSKKPKRNENQDGLIYVELDFDKQQNGKKPTIIIGDDDRTPYAEVDFTKKADPLPDSDEDNP